MRKVFATVAALGFACGTGDSSYVETASATSVADVAVVADDGIGAVHTVNMVMTPAGTYEFQPKTLTIKVGDTVRWVNVSGGPHNVQFFKDQIPAGAEAVLTAAMQGRTISPLSGSLMMAPNASYEVVFTGAPTGTYGYTCTPHQLLGMNATLTVE